MTERCLRYSELDGGIANVAAASYDSRRIRVGMREEELYDVEAVMQAGEHEGGVRVSLAFIVHSGGIHTLI